MKRLMFALSFQCATQVVQGSAPAIVGSLHDTTLYECDKPLRV